jgi:uncharacterized protein (TIGR02757 family)
MNIEVASFLNEQYDYYAKHFNITLDPLSIPKQYTLKQDIEIAGFLASTIAWGNRKAILNSAQTLMQYMDNAPYDFVINHKESDLKKLANFYYRTFNATDLLYFIAFLKTHYSSYDSLESAFTMQIKDVESVDMYDMLYNFHNYFFSLAFAPDRTRKHIGNVKKNSACKRLNMFLRWMVRDSDVDFGIWKSITKDKLICPLDVHVQTIAKSLGVLERKQADWKAAQLLTDTLRKFDASDPVKYDIVLFSLGVERRMVL